MVMIIEDPVGLVQKPNWKNLIQNKIHSWLQANSTN